jgi:hypothetical protein
MLGPLYFVVLGFFPDFCFDSDFGPDFGPDFPDSGYPGNPEIPAVVGFDYSGQHSDFSATADSVGLFPSPPPTFLQNIVPFSPNLLLPALRSKYLAIVGPVLCLSPTVALSMPLVNVA